MLVVRASLFVMASSIIHSLATSVSSSPSHSTQIPYPMPNQTWLTNAPVKLDSSGGIRWASAGSAFTLMTGQSSHSGSVPHPKATPITLSRASVSRTNSTTTDSKTMPSHSPTIAEGLNLDAFPYNLNNQTCDDLTHMGNGSQQWTAVDGDKAVEKFQQMFDNNLLICEDCYGLAVDKCQSKDPKCGLGLRNLSYVSESTDPRWDTAAAHFAENAEWSDLQCGIQTGECTSAPTCKSCNGPGSFAILKSLQVMNVALMNTYNAIQEAGQHCTDQMAAFSSAFAPIPDIRDKAMFLGVSTSIVGGMFGFIPGAGGALTGMLAGVGTSVAMDEFYMNQPGPADSASTLGLIANSTAAVVLQFADSLFKTGSYTYTSADGTKGKVQTLQQMMKGGASMGETAGKNDHFPALVPVFERIMYQQLAVFTWNNTQKDGKRHIPFITFTSGPCDKVDGKMKVFERLFGILASVPSMKSGITYNETCWWLLDGTEVEPESGCRGCKAICEAQALPGGTTDDMEKNKHIFSDLSLEDFIVPSIEGWARNGKRNDYVSASANGQLLSNPRSPGAVNIPVCDYIGNGALPGARCPKLRSATRDGGCDIHPRNEEENTPGATAPGLCRVHVFQYQKNEGDENIFDQYQLKMVVYDDADRMVGESAKELASQPLALKSSLPFHLIAGVGSIDKDAVEFWYADQYWNSNDGTPDHQCKVGGYDNGVRNMDCRFPCSADPPTYGNTQSATATHHLTAVPTEAVLGEFTFVNTYNEPSETAVATLAAPTLVPDNIKDGTCHVHVRQHQKNEPDNRTPDYELEITIFDNTNHPIGQSGMVPGPAEQRITVSGLHFLLVVATRKIDSDPLDFALKTSLWDSNVKGDVGKGDISCNVGKYDSGHRDMDCWFPCDPADPGIKIKGGGGGSPLVHHR